MNIPQFLVIEGAKPMDAYEWTLWGILQVCIILMVIVSVPFILLFMMATIVGGLFE